MNIYQTKKEKESIPTVMKTCFSDGKLMKQFGTPSLSTNPLFLSNFFMTPPPPPPPPTFCPNFKNKNKTTIYKQVKKTRNLNRLTSSHLHCLFENRHFSLMLESLQKKYQKNECSHKVPLSQNLSCDYFKTSLTFSLATM